MAQAVEREIEPRRLGRGREPARDRPRVATLPIAPIDNEAEVVPPGATEQESLVLRLAMGAQSLDHERGGE